MTRPSASEAASETLCATGGVSTASREAARIALAHLRGERPPCRYPAHRASDWLGDGGRLVCAACHPRAGQAGR